MVDNYTQSEDYAGPFVDINGSYSYIGLDHCWNPEVGYREATKATAITFMTSPQFSGGFGYDKYSQPIQLFSW